MMRSLVKNKAFMVGFLFVFVLIIASLTHSVFFDSVIPQKQVIYDEDGATPLYSAPFSPSFQFPLGTDRYGYDMFYKIIQGAKFTISLTFIVSFFTLIFSFGLGIIYGLWRSNAKKGFSIFSSAFYFVPQSIIAYNILHPVLWEGPDGFETTLTERIIFQLCILILISIPTTSVLIGNEIGRIMKEDFIESSRTLGGNRLHILRKHVWIHLKPKLLIIFTQLIIQTLLVIAHLGLFKLYFGGTEVCYGPMCDPPKTLSNEWSGLLGMYYFELRLAKWLFIGPLTFFALTILSLNFVLIGLKQVMQNQNQHVKTNNKIKDSGGVVKRNKLDFRLIRNS
jgi:peptide/nickel transport system permease protein